MMELPGEDGSLDFFLGEVSVITGDTEREYGSARCNRISGGNGSCGLNGAGAEGGTCRTSDDEGSIMQGVRLD
jgi:hypothetical protein